jgi:hypothetical protein
MSPNILQSVKKTLNLAADYEAFDQDVIMHINAVFSTLHQLGVGPGTGFAIEDGGETWQQFLGNDPRLNNIKTYIYLRVRLLFDPPTTGFHVTAMKEQISELEWRINTHREDTQWTDPTPPVVLLEE